MKFVKTITVDGKEYNIYYSAISYKCPALGIFGERTEITCTNSIKRKLRKKK